jgi:hypothetical protein
MSNGPQSSVSVTPARAGQLLRGAGQQSRLLTVTPALNLIVAGVEATPINQGISLSVPPEKADCITVWVGYDAGQGNSVPVVYSPSPIWPASAADQPTRRLFALIKWGAAGGQQYAEIDVSEGCGLVVPCATCEVYLYSEQTAVQAGINSVEIDPAIQPQPTWTVNVHAAPGRTAVNARRTRQVVDPFLVPASAFPPNPIPRRPREAVEARALIDDARGIDPAALRSWTKIARSLIEGSKRK